MTRLKFSFRFTNKKGLKMIPIRERNTIIKSLSAGVVPGVGIQHIQVGRNDEVQALVRDLEIIEHGGAACRFIIGRFGSGKTFFLNLLRTVALQRKFVVVQADITIDRRLHGSTGQARLLYRELLRNISTKSKPEGGALPNIVERWVGEVDHEIRAKGGSDKDIRGELIKRLKPLQEFVSGFDFANVIAIYFDGYLNNDEAMQQSALRWLRGEFSTKTEARQELGVRTIIEDNSIYEYLKLMAAFVRLAGFSGLLVNVDELVVLSHRLNSSIARNNNYETILRIVNDCLQGRASGIGFIFAGTPECLEDRRRGVFSYEALATRLAPNRFASDERRDLNSPVIRLESLTPEDCYVLLHKIRDLFDEGDPAKRFFPDEAIEGFLEVCQQRMGASYFQTPRDTVKDFVGLMQVLKQNPGASWNLLLESKRVEPFSPTHNPDLTGSESGDDMTIFRL